MRNYTSLTLGLIVSFGFAISHAQQQSDRSTGMWLSESRSGGGLGSWIDLRPDGTAQFGFGAVVEGTYRFEGTSLSIKVRDSDREQHSEMRIDGDTAIRRQTPPNTG